MEEAETLETASAITDALMANFNLEEFELEGLKDMHTALKNRGLTRHDSLDAEEHIDAQQHSTPELSDSNANVTSTADSAATDCKVQTVEDGSKSDSTVCELQTCGNVAARAHTASDVLLPSPSPTPSDAKLPRSPVSEDDADHSGLPRDPEGREEFPSNPEFGEDESEVQNGELPRGRSSATTAVTYSPVMVDDEEDE